MVYFQTVNPNLWLILEGLRLDNVKICYGHLEYFTAIWHILWPFCNVVINWYIFHRFGILCQEKSGNPGTKLKVNLHKT
jgi:hypothetical protein